MPISAIAKLVREANKKIQKTDDGISFLVLFVILGLIGLGVFLVLNLIFAGG